MENQLLTLKNNELTVQINPKGAELTHVIENKNKFDFIWNGSEWPKHAPILFPAIGRSTDDEYLLNLKIQFEIKNLSVKKLTFALGFHPAFNLSANFEDYQISFETKDKTLKQFEIVKNPFPYRSGKIIEINKAVSNF